MKIDLFKLNQEYIGWLLAIKRYAEIYGWVLGTRFATRQSKQLDTPVQ
jgi:hypothetical protein